MPIETLDHTADVGFTVEAASLASLYAQAAMALTDAVTDVAAVRPVLLRRVRVTADDRELLLVEWLEELVYYLDAELLVFSRADVELQDDGGGGLVLTATLHGETYDPERHPAKVAVKGVTYHGLEVRRDGERWRARVILDV